MTVTPPTASSKPTTPPAAAWAIHGRNLSAVRAALLTDGTYSCRTPCAPNWPTGRALFETTLSARNGATIPAEIHASRYTWHGHTMVLMIARDISERRRLETGASGRWSSAASSYKSGKPGRSVRRRRAWLQQSPGNCRQ